MGFVDFLVPFASSIGLAVFEAIVFALAVLSVFVAWYAVKHVRNGSEDKGSLKVNTYLNPQSLSITRHNIAVEELRCRLNQAENLV